MRAPAYQYLITIGTLAVAAVAAALLYQHYEEFPWTRDGQVRANVVGITSRISGPILQIPIRDNQPVKKGDLLFEIDPATFQVALHNAQAQLSQTQATALQDYQNLQRQTQLYETKVVDQQTYQDAQDQYLAAEANVQAATAQVETAQLNLKYTKVFAPVDGLITNLNTSPGTYVTGGTQLLALIDASSFWIAAYFKETQLKHIAPGSKAKITLMGHTAQPFEGVVDSVGWGVYQSDGATVELLPNISQTIDWIRLPNRFAVRIHATGKPPVPLRIGQTVSISIQ